MLIRLKLFVNKLMLSKYTLWLIDISLLLCICYLFFSLKQESLVFPSAGDGAGYSQADEGPRGRDPALPLALLARRVRQLNAARVVLNEGAFGEPGPRGAVLAVTARRGAARLRRLLASLERAPDIGSALLVVSHSFYDEGINGLVRGVRFCRVLQVFYPYSRQLYPDRFPGPDPADCPGGRGGRAGSFCSPRDAALVEHKHHWWWTAHFLFNHLIWEFGHGGAVLFLQEDDYVLSDALHVLQFAERALAYHPDADVVSLGAPGGADPQYDLLTVDPWRPPLDRGLAFNASMWRRIEPLAARYCSYDDASWSYSLLNLFAGLPRGRADAVASVAPRVLAARGGAAAAAAAAAAPLFPARVRSVFVAAPGGRAGERMRAPPHGAGGWADPRDHLLCLDPFLVTTTSAPVTTILYVANRTFG